jgi:hypothetical protein
MMYIFMIFISNIFDKYQKIKGKPLLALPVKNSDRQLVSKPPLLAASSTAGSQQPQGDAVFLGTMLA